MIITIDGPAGTGKTTIARRLAECLHFAYFDTGAMYRCVAFLMLKKGVTIHDGSAIEALLKEFSFSIQMQGSGKHYFVGEEDVTEKIRSPEVTKLASQAGTLKPVRDLLSSLQRSFAKKQNVVFEGRDLGTVVFPHAEIKIFLTARPEIRAKRRLDEQIKLDEQIDFHQVLSDIMRRDESDSTRAIAPLRCAEDAYQIDTSDLSIDEVVELILKYKMSKDG